MNSQRASLLGLGLALGAVAGVSVWESTRLAALLKIRGALDALSADRYLFAVSVALLVMALLLVARALRRDVAAPAPAADAPAPAADAAATAADADHPAHRQVLAALCGYAVLLWIAGYLVATLLFMVAALRIMGVARWRAVLALAVAVTAVFWLLFVQLAGVALPRGLLG